MSNLRRVLGFLRINLHQIQGSGEHRAGAAPISGRKNLWNCGDVCGGRKLTIRHAGRGIAAGTQEACIMSPMWTVNQRSDAARRRHPDKPARPLWECAGGSVLWVRTKSGRGVVGSAGRKSESRVKRQLTPSPPSGL